MSERVIELNQRPAGAPEFERTPPQDNAAEQSVLGGMLLNKDAIADVVEVVKSTDFYRPAHQIVFDIILDLYGKGEPADAITVGAELTKNGDVGRVGGLPYLHTLVSTVPTAANAGYYAKIVAELAILRRLVEAGTRIVQLGYSAEGNDVDDIVDRAQQAIYDVTERRTSEDYTLLAELMNPTMDELETIGGRNGLMSGVPTGFQDLDQLTNGLHPGQMIVIAGRPGMGKALALDTPLPTPTGWTTMGAVQVGDELLGADGRPTTVVAATEVMADRPCLRVTFSDGTTIVADAQHQWVTSTRAERRAVGGPKSAIRTTEQLAGSVRAASKDARLNHSVVTTRALQLPVVDLPLSPYVLGAWLGAGQGAGARLTIADEEIVMYLEVEGLEVRKQSGTMLYGLGFPGRVADHGTVQAVLRTLGLLHNKHVPSAYLRAGAEQRRALLAGLMDTDGTVTASGSLQFTATNRRLADEVQELVLSLGHRVTMTSRRVRGRSAETSTAYTLSWTAEQRTFRLERKHLLHKEHSRATAARGGVRWITSVVRVESVPVRCVEVDNADHLYLASRAFIPTHNSTLGLDIARSASIKHGQTAAIFSLEMSKTEITMRLLSAEARVALHHMRSGSMTDDDWARLARRMGEVAEAPLFIDDSPNLTMMEIRSKARRLKQRHDLKLVVVDYLQLMQGNKRAESRQQEVSEISRALKLLAKELELPVIAMSQLNRGAEQRTDKKPQLSDLRESGCLPASTRVLRADTGAETTMGELFASGARDVPVWSLDPSLRYVRRHLTHVFSTGVKPVFRLRLASGKTVRATANHPFLTYDGWMPLAELVPGTMLAVPRHVPAPSQETAWPQDRVTAVADALAAGVPLPDEAFSLPKASLRDLLRRALALTVLGVGEVQRYGLAAATADQVSRLLLRFGISCVLVPLNGKVQLVVSGPDDLARLRGQVESGLQGEAAGEQVLSELRQDRVPQTVPDHVWERVQAAMEQQVAVPAGRLSAVAAALSSAELALEATNDVFWDCVEQIVPDGAEEVFDATVVGNHNFIADGVAVHNSIEQDADMVVLLHREDAYEKESPRAGEADFIVAKHRNGPTATITVAFQGHYSRFVDMTPA